MHTQPKESALKHRPVRVLQVVSQMRPGGIETWLMLLLRRLDPAKTQLDFLVHATEEREYDKEILDRGCRILRCPNPHRVWDYSRRMAAILKEHGPFDVVHTHAHHFSGVHVYVAKQAKVPIRITHCHQDSARIDQAAPLGRRMYQRLMQSAMWRYATHGLAASSEAAEALYGANWRNNPKFRVVYCGIDLESFHVDHNRDAIRAELGIPQDAVVVGHVGRLSAPKNHRYFIEIAKEIVRIQPRARFLLVGDGELRSEIEGWIQEAGLASVFHLAGSRNDIARIHTAMDVFLFPSVLEGISLAFIEAQSSGLPCVASKVLPNEANIPGCHVDRVSLDESPAHWARVVLDAAAQRTDKASALSAVEKSPFNIHTGVAELERIYHGDA